MTSEMSEVDALLASGDYGAVASLLDAAELEAAASPPEDWPYALHMLGHMVNAELENARFVWKRAPDHRKASDEELRAVFALLQSMWNRDYPAVHRAASGAGSAWSAKLAPVVQHLEHAYRMQTMTLLTRAYTTVSVTHLARCLGVSEAEANEMGRGAGWELDAAAGMFAVVKPPATEEQTLAMENLQKLTEYTMHLSEISANEKET